MEKETFSYHYSSKRNLEVEAIRKKYMPEEENRLETLKKMDRKAQSAGTVESLCIGVVGTLLFGIGMCFFLKVFAGGGLPAALFMILGLLIALTAYPIYRHISRSTKEKLTPEILRLSGEIIGS